MKVAFGMTLVAKGLATNGIDGIGNYSNELYKSLANKQTLELSPYIFGYKPASINHLDKLNRFNSYYHQLVFGALGQPITKNSFLSKVDLVHATDHLVPITSGVPLIASVMDAIPLSCPEYLGSHSYLSKLKYQFWALLTRRSDRVITISEYSKQQISKHFKISPDKITVIPLGVDCRFFDEIPEVQRKTVRSRYGIPDRFLLSVGTLQPRKNLIRVFDAFKFIPLDQRRATPLVVVGRIGWATQEIEKYINQATHEGWCIRLNHISDFELRALLQSATALLFPSLAEGFGLPVLEAFASKTPVITSNTTSLPEVANGAAILVNPLLSGEIYEAITYVCNHQNELDELVQKGYEHARKMTWDRCADLTFDVYRQLA